MRELLFMLIAAVILCLLAAFGLAIGKVITGKNRLHKRCGKLPEEASTCGLCGKERSSCTKEGKGGDSC